MKRFGLEELRVIDSDEDSDEFPSPSRALPALRTVPTASPGCIDRARKQEDGYTQAQASRSLTQGGAGNAVTREGSTGFASIRTDEPSSPVCADPSVTVAVHATLQLTSQGSGGDEIEGRPSPPEYSGSAVDAPAGDSQSGVPSRDLAPTATAEEVSSAVYMEEVVSAINIEVQSPLLSPPPGTVSAEARASPSPRRVDPASSPLLTIASPSIRVETVRRHRDPMNRDQDSDNESVEFVEVGSERASGSAAKACALVLEDGREVTPDSFDSGSGTCDETRRPDAEVYTTNGDWDASPNTQRGDSMTGRLTARSGTGSGLSLYQQRLIERQQEEQRRLQAELEQQWQDLTFRPELNDQQLDFFHAQPYYVRLHGDAVKKQERQRRASQQRKSIDRQMHHPKLSEKTLEMVSGVQSDIYDRLYPGKRRSPAPAKKPKCGTTAVFARLTVASRACASVPDIAVRQGCTFKPEITQTAQQLTSKKTVVDRLYCPRKEGEKK